MKLYHCVPFIVLISHPRGRSSVFALNLKLHKVDEKPIQMKDMTARALEEFLFFLYTGRFRESFNVEVSLSFLLQSGVTMECRID